MKILFLRHGESTDDLDNQYGGWADFSLTSRGEEQAHAVIPYITFLGLHFARVFASPLRRAAQVAAIVSSALSVPCETLEYLKERNGYGILSGLKKSAAEKKYPEQVRNLNSGIFVHGSERYEDFVVRVKESLVLLAAAPYENIICVTHGGYFKCLGKESLSMPISRIEDCGYMLCNLEDGKVTYISSHGVDFDL